MRGADLGAIIDANMFAVNGPMAGELRVEHARVQANGCIPEELSNIDEGIGEKKATNFIIRLMGAATDHSCSGCELLRRTHATTVNCYRALDGRLEGQASLSQKPAPMRAEESIWH